MAHNDDEESFETGYLPFQQNSTAQPLYLPEEEGSSQWRTHMLKAVIIESSLVDGCGLSHKHLKDG